VYFESGSAAAQDRKLEWMDRHGKAQNSSLPLNTLPHTAMERVCYEVKTSHGDFLSELRPPAEATDRDAVLERVLLRHARQRQNLGQLW
jgi:hypothetical protein